MTNLCTRLCLVFAITLLLATSCTSAAPSAGDSRVGVDPEVAATAAVLRGHTSWVVDIVELSDGRFASAGWGDGSTDGVVNIWDPNDLTVDPVTYSQHERSVFSLDELADGRIVSAGGNAVHVWDPAEPEQTMVAFTEHDGNEATAVYASPLGWIASADSVLARFWDPVNPSEVVATPISFDDLTDFAELPDGRVLSSGLDGTVAIWGPDNVSFSAIERYRGHEPTPVFAVRVDQDGLVTSVDSDGSVHRWDPDAPDVTISTVVNPNLHPLRTALLADGSVALGMDQAIALLDPEAPDGDLRVYAGHRDGITAITMLSDGRVASGSRDGEVHVWDPNGSTTLVDPATFAAQQPSDVATTDSATAPVTAPPAEDAAASSAASPETSSSSSSGRPEDWFYGGHEGGGIVSVMQLRDGRVLSTGYSSTHLWDPDGESAAAVRTNLDSVMVNLELADGRIASGMLGGYVDLWDPAAPTRIAGNPGFEGHRDAVVSLVELGTGDIVSGDFGGVAQVWNPGSADAPIGTYTGHEDAITEIELLGISGAFVASVSLDGSLQLWNPLFEGTGITAPGQVPGGILDVVELPDGRLAAAGADGIVRLLTVDTDTVEIRVAAQYDGHPRLPVTELAVLADGRVASAGGTEIHIWDPVDPTTTQQVFDRHRDDVWSLAALDDGRIASGGRDGVWVWTPTTASE